MDDDIPPVPLSPQLRARLTAAAGRAFRVRREIMLLAASACGHLPGPGQVCRACHERWPCGPVHATARTALAAVADLRA